MKKHLTVYVRRGCHLCSDMTVALQRLQGELEFSVSEVDIDRDPALIERYATRVPVLSGGDVELCDYFLDEQRLRAWCARSGKGPDRSA